MAIGGRVSTTLLCVRLLPLVGSRPIARVPALLIGAISAGAAISNQGLNGGSAKILLAPSLNGGSRHNKPSLTISNHLVPFLLSY